MTVTHEASDLGSLGPAERDVLVLLEAHAQATETPAARRTTLEAYVRDGGLWEHTHAGLRRTLSESLHSLRSAYLVVLVDDGFRLTEHGQEVLDTLEQIDQGIDDLVDQTSNKILDLQRVWHTEVR